MFEAVLLIKNLSDGYENILPPGASNSELGEQIWMALGATRFFDDTNEMVALAGKISGEDNSAWKKDCKNRQA